MTTKTDLRKALTKKGFKAWLEEFGDRKIVGVAREWDSCPIQRYLSLELGDNKIVVVNDHFWTDENYSKTTVDLPAWARCFIKEIDEETMANVKAKRAKEILEAC